ncbi:metallophosphoesterase [Paenibacillus methanolicus]|uniref:Putative MPP superfamily phosphohydrolase n=1 Tax=Paenibacillus methanolicus TaxID=582686 RepID=A0A5S5CHU6_9BACL|nr:metallophosphoesterase [Paenibacillus methanolicus]TYP77796.1 putative MPP superfamily phosphohydrolase [Paenibacillus methanolicus]
MVYSLAIAAATAVIGLSVAIYAMYRYAHRYQVDEQTISSSRLPASFDGVKLLFVSDIHGHRIPQTVVDACTQYGDIGLVLIGGDLREGGVPLERSRGNIRALRNIAPIYVVYGNHDYDDDIRSLEVMLREEGVRLLTNEAVLLEQAEGGAIRLAGVDDPRTNREDVRLALGGDGANDDLFTLLLAHDPVIADRLLPEQAARIDYILAGHTHGGQIVLPIIGPLVTSKNVRTYLRGWYNNGEERRTSETASPRMFVSCGFGTSKFPLRLAAPAQVHIVTLRALS